MSSSKYPNQIDSSIELPAVRDNILSVGSDAINGLRSAIFQIEKTLGVNPQGTVGNTVASRLNNVIDGNGNILQSAIATLNLLSGPISNADVSNIAAILESKLNLDYPTALLQSEITITEGKVEVITKQLNEINALLTAHINQNSFNRHPATAISLKQSSQSFSGDSLKEVDTTNLQEFAESVVTNHINFNGVVDPFNNSHTAEQIYFDNSGVNLNSTNLQDVIEELSVEKENGFDDHQKAMHSNGMPRIGYISPIIFANNVSVTFSRSPGVNDLSVIVVNVPFAANLKTSDIVEIVDPNLPIHNARYEINSVVKNGVGNIISISVYGVLPVNSTLDTVINVYENSNKTTNKLLTTFVEEAVLTSSYRLHVSNPNFASALSVGVKPSEITLSNRFINISTNGFAFDYNMFNGVSTRQSIDAMVSVLNEQFAEQKAGCLAYRYDEENKDSEILISMMCPGELIISVSSDAGIKAAGFAHLSGQVIVNKSGSDYFIDGYKFSGLKEKINSDELIYFQGSNEILSGTSGIDFVAAGVKKDDVITLTGGSDDGSYKITSVEANKIIVDINQLVTGWLQSNINTRFLCYEDTTTLADLAFRKVSGSFGSALVDVFMDGSQNISYVTRFEYSPLVVGVDDFVSIVDFKGNITDKTYTIDVSQGTSVNVSVNGGPITEVTGMNRFVWVRSGDDDVYLKLLIKDAETLHSVLGVPMSVVAYGYSGINEQSNMLLGRVNYGNYIGRFSGGEYGPRVLQKFSLGNINKRDFAATDLITTPINDLRSNGVISGLIVTADLVANIYRLFISAGTCYVGGNKFEFEDQEILTDIDSGVSDKIFIAVDEYGNIKFSPAIIVGTECYSPFGYEHCILSTLEVSQGAVLPYDLRLFINEVDYRILNSITVSPQPGMGHFSDLRTAIAYSKRFRQQFNNAMAPKIHLKSGVHRNSIVIDESSISVSTWLATLLLNRRVVLKRIYNAIIDRGIFVDFPLMIDGEGNSTEITLDFKFVFSDGEFKSRGVMLIPGDSFIDTDLGVDLFNSGSMKFSNVKFKNTIVNMVDLSVMSSLDELMNFHVDFTDCIFDFSEYIEGPIDNAFGSWAILLNSLANQGIKKGNFSVNNCKFIECGISGPANLMQNVNIMNNSIYRSDISGFLSTNFYTFNIAKSSANINIQGNSHFGNQNLSGVSGQPEMIAGSGFGWGDRISRDLHVGGVVNPGSIVYNDSRFKTHTFSWDKVNNPSVNGTGSAFINGTIANTSMPTTNPDFPTVRVRTVLVDDTLSTIMPLELPQRSTIRRIDVILAVESGIPPATMFCRLMERDTVGGLSLTGISMAVTPEITLSRVTHPTAAFAQYSIDLNYLTDFAGLRYLLIRGSTSTSVKVAYVRVVTEHRNMENLLGLNDVI